MRLKQSFNKQPTAHGQAQMHAVKGLAPSLMLGSLHHTTAKASACRSTNFTASEVKSGG